MQQVRTARPIYLQVKDAIHNRIIAGEWNGSEFLPSKSRLAKEYGVNEETLKRALDALANDRVLKKHAPQQ